MMEQDRLKNPAKVSLGVLVLLLILAIVFYRERIFTDSSFIAMNIINYGNLQIQCERYGSFITQIFPLIAVKLHLPLKTLLTAYSASFNIFYLGTALFLYFRLKDYPLVILMGLYYTLHVTQTYFWTNNELQQAVCWMFLTFAALKYMANRPVTKLPFVQHLTTFLVFSTLALLSIFTHPATIFPFMFLWVYYWVEHKEKPFSTKWVFLYLGVIITICAFKFFFISSNSYDNSVSTPLRKISLIDLLHAFTSGTADYFWKSISTTNWLLPVFFIISLIVLFRQKKYLLASWVLVASVGYFVILCVTFTVDVVFYLESEFMPMTIFGATAFVYYVLPRIKRERTIVLVLTGIFLIRAGFILYASKKFTARVGKMEEVMSYMKQENINKMILLREDDRFEHESMNTGWGMAYESLMHSKLKGDSVTATFIYLFQGEIDNLPIQDSLRDIRTPWSVTRKTDWNPEYFRTDSLQPYLIKKYEEVFQH